MRVLHVAALLSPTLVLFTLAHGQGAAPDDPQLAIKNTVIHNLLEPAFKLAVATVDRNTHQGILAAGADYGGEWTRDCAINAWNGVSLLRPRIAETSLWSVTKNRQTIGHQYWDKIIWTIGAWNHYKVTGSRDFLAQAYPCAGDHARVGGYRVRQAIRAVHGAFAPVRRDRRLSRAAPRLSEPVVVCPGPSQHEAHEGPEHQRNLLRRLSVPRRDGPGVEPTHDGSRRIPSEGGSSSGGDQRPILAGKGESLRLLDFARWHVGPFPGGHGRGLCAHLRPLRQGPRAVAPGQHAANAARHHLRVAEFPAIHRQQAGAAQQHGLAHAQRLLGICGRHARRHESIPVRAGEQRASGPRSRQGQRQLPRNLSRDLRRRTAGGSRVRIGAPAITRPGRPQPISAWCSTAWWASISSPADFSSNHTCPQATGP